MGWIHGEESGRSGRSDLRCIHGAESEWSCPKCKAIREAEHEASMSAYEAAKAARNRKWWEAATPWQHTAVTHVRNAFTDEVIPITQLGRDCRVNGTWVRATPDGDNWYVADPPPSEGVYAPAEDCCEQFEKEELELAALQPKKVEPVQVINCTPHPISIELPDGTRRTIEPSGTIPRLTSQTVDLDPIDGIPVSQTILGDVENLPDPQPGIYLIVSAFVQSACPDRADLLRPDTGPDCVRDEKGRILAVRRLTR